MKTSELSCAFMGYTFSDTYWYKATLICISSLCLTLSMPTFLINTCIIVSIIRKREFHTPAFTVITNLAISDSLAGCSGYIFYATTCMRFAMGYDACPVAYIGTSWSYILGITSYNTIALQTVERFLAIFFPYWYHEKLTVKSVAIANVVTWLLSISLVTFWLITKDNRAYNGILGSLSLISFAVTVLSYLLIFREVRKIENAMIKHQTASREDRKKIRSESKVAKATAIILLAVVTCYTPMLFIEFYVAFIGSQTESFSIALYWAWFLAFSNSFINPLIVCRQLTALRRAVKEILFCLCPWVGSRWREVMPSKTTTSFAMTRTSQGDLDHGKISCTVLD